MSNESYRSLNTDYICGQYKEPEPFEDKPGLFHRDIVEQHIEQGIITDLAESRVTPGRFLSHKRFAKFYYLEIIQQYFAGIFPWESEDEDFKADYSDIWEEIIGKGFLGDIYISADKKLHAKEKSLVESRNKCWWRAENRPYSKIRLYTMEHDEEKKEPTFRSVWTNIGGLKINPEKLVYFSLNGFKNFIGFWQILEEYLSGLDAVVNYFHASIKRIGIDVQDKANAEAQISHYVNSKMPLMIMDNVHRKGGHTDNSWFEFPAPDLEGNAQVIRAVQAWWDERTKWYGMYGTSLRQTKERSNVGETFMDYDFANSIRKSYAIKVEAMVCKLKKMWPSVFPEDLTIKKPGEDFMQDDQFQEMNNWKGGDKSEGNHHNGMKPGKE